MLRLKNIVKTYVTDDIVQHALRGVSVNFRDNEFVSVLGHSGSGKTTMLNIIGGLDRYTSGELVINGVSTEKYTDADWDVYRNRRIGFIFQSYNLIPHQTVLSNVEMALTLSGVSKKERRERSVKMLERVGLGEHMNKRPNQMSGGQMQRVAIARALVNDPDILLADEPTGALDSETSIQIMELLKEIAKDKLVIMVTHNPELAEQYSTRIVKLKDGEIVSDTDPYEENDEVTGQKKQKKISLSFLTALSLSFNNLRTKKGRTLLTSFAGSIGIIGIALILSLSTGMNEYITDMQKKTMSSYPVTINSEDLGFSDSMSLNEIYELSCEYEDREAIYADYEDIISDSDMSMEVTHNDLANFKKYLDDPESEIHEYLGSNGIKYSYDTVFSVYSYAPDGKFVNSAALPRGYDNFPVSYSAVYGGNRKNFSELIAGSDGETVSKVVTDSYELIYGNYPENYNEVLLVLDRNNTISLDNMCRLGLITDEQYSKTANIIRNGGTADDIVFDYEDACGHKFYLVTESDLYEEKEGVFSKIDDSFINKDTSLKNAVELKITGVVRQAGEVTDIVIDTPVAYTSGLTDYIIKHTAESPVVTAQKKTPDINVLNGKRFGMPSNKNMMFDMYGLAAETSYEENMKTFGNVSYDAPSSISIYADDFNGKDGITHCIKKYNSSVDDSLRISYTDYMAEMTSSLTSVINGISYVLISFVAVSLVVSCIMIGIITHISVMERTKEIGILRALGADKKSISQVFNAETFIIGCCSGITGVAATMLLLVPINAVISMLVDDMTLSAHLPLTSSVILIAVSVLITMLGGLIPAKKASNKDPVIALRTE